MSRVLYIFVDDGGVPASHPFSAKDNLTSTIPRNLFAIFPYFTCPHHTVDHPGTIVHAGKNQTMLYSTLRSSPIAVTPFCLQSMPTNLPEKEFPMNPTTPPLVSGGLPILGHAPEMMAQPRGSFSARVCRTRNHFCIKLGPQYAAVVSGAEYNKIVIPDRPQPEHAVMRTRFSRRRLAKCCSPPTRKPTTTSARCCRKSSPA